jgi:hypothetical protein
LQLIKDAQRRFEHRCRTYADIFVQESDSDNENEEKSDSDASSSTDSDSPYGSDSESSSSYDEYHAERKIPKKKIHRHHKGPIKLYFEERIGNWPKFRFKKYKRDHMKKHGIQINYGNIQTKEIKHSVKQEKRQRKNEDSYPVNVSIMMEDLAKLTPSLLLDPKYPIVPIELDKSAYKSSKNEQIETKSTSTFHKMKLKIKKSFKKDEPADNTSTDDGDDEQVATNSDVASRTSDNNEFQKSNQSLEKVSTHPADQITLF